MLTQTYVGVSYVCFAYKENKQYEVRNIMRHLTFILILIFALAACAEDNTDDADIIEDDAVEAEATALLAPTFTIEIPDLDLTYPTEDLLGTVVAYEPVATPSLTFDALGDGAKVTFMFERWPGWAMAENNDEASRAS